MNPSKMKQKRAKKRNDTERAKLKKIKDAAEATKKLAEDLGKIEDEEDKDET